MEQNDLKRAVQMAAGAWVESSYYDWAEEGIDIYWGKASPFYKAFADLDLTSVVELACGHSRHAAQIIERVGHITLIDIHQANIDFSKARLGHFPNTSFFVNNGYNFEPVPDSSITSVYCYDAMVHFQPEVVGSYIKDLSRILVPGGMALLQHSNYDAPGVPYHRNPNSRNHMTFEIFSSFVSGESDLELVSSRTLSTQVEDIDRLSLIRKR